MTTATPRHRRRVTLWKLDSGLKTKREIYDELRRSGIKVWETRGFPGRWSCLVRPDRRSAPVLPARAHAAPEDPAAEPRHAPRHGPPGERGTTGSPRPGSRVTGGALALLGALCLALGAPPAETGPSAPPRAPARAGVYTASPPSSDSPSGRHSVSSESNHSSRRSFRSFGSSSYTLRGLTRSSKLERSSRSHSSKSSRPLSSELKNPSSLKKESSYTPPSVVRGDSPLEVQDGSEQSVVLGEIDQLPSRNNFYFYLTNNDPGAIYNSATFDLGSVLSEPIQKIIDNNPNYSSIGEVLDNVDINIRGPPNGEVDRGWKYSIDSSTGVVDFTHIFF